MLTLVAALLLVGAALNIGSGLVNLVDQSSSTNDGALATITYWGLSSIVFGVVQAVGALLLFRRRREGAAVVYVVAVLDAAYWIPELSFRPLPTMLVLSTLIAIVTMTVARRHELS